MTQRIGNSFFPYCKINWNALGDDIKLSNSITEFKRCYLKNMAIRPQRNDYFNIADKHGLTLLTRLRVDFSDLREHRFNHRFNCPSPICKCTLDEETIVHFLLRCPRYIVQRRVLLASVSDIIKNDINQLPNDHVTDLLLLGSRVFNAISTKLILEATIRYIKSSMRFKTIEAYDNM